MRSPGGGTLAARRCSEAGDRDNERWRLTLIATSGPVARGSDARDDEEGSWPGERAAGHLIERCFVRGAMAVASQQCTIRHQEMRAGADDAIVGAT